MVVIAVKHHPEDMKSSFILDFLESPMLRRKRGDANKVNLLLNEVTKRVEANDAELLQGANFHRLIAYCDKYIKARSSLIKKLAGRDEAVAEGSSRKSPAAVYNPAFIELMSKKGNP